MGGHCFSAVVLSNATTTSSSFTLTAMTNTIGIVVGMPAVDTGNASVTNAVVSVINSNSSVSLSNVAAGSHTATPFTFSGDQFKLALFAGSVTNSFGATTVNYSDMGADETSGAGYTAGGVNLTTITPTVSSGVAIWSFSPNPTFTSATFSTSGALIYNSSIRIAGLTGTNTVGAGRALGVFPFAGNTSVSGATLTVVMPTLSSTAACFRIA